MKTFVPGAIASAADVNSNFTELANRASALETNRPTVNTAGVITGTVMAGQPIIQAGIALVTTNSAGDFSLNLPTPFAHGLLAAVVSPADPGVGDRTAIVHIGTSATLSSINARAFQTNGSPLANTAAQWSYIAFGW